MRCHNCGSDKTESDSASGTTYCINCGTVLEENTIVAEVTFGETSGGKAVLQGSYAGESGRISGGGLFGRNRGREGQEQAIENGRVKIASLAHAVRLPERYRDAAQRYYNLAVVNRFTRGRRSDHVAAVCLYAVCRAEKSSHMLIDFSDILQVNVFTLGATFLKLCRILNIQLPHVDPSLYISRFAVALDFGDYTQRVAQDAVRIAQRMDRDWITSGRRPAGICGACLLIAARMNGFRRTTSEMIHIVKVADVTIQKRLQEFNQTESAQLSVRDFRTIWLENRADPPSFQKNRKPLSIEGKEKVNEESSNKENELDDEENLENSEDKETNASRKRKGKGRADERPPKHRSTEKSKIETTGSTSQKRKGKEVDIDSHSKKQRLDHNDDEDDDDKGDKNVKEIQEVNADYIPIKNAHYEELSTEEKVALTAIAREKIAREEAELLNPGPQGDTMEILDDLETWLTDDNIMKAANEIKKQKHGKDINEVEKINEEKHKEIKKKEEERNDEDDEELAPVDDGSLLVNPNDDQDDNDDDNKDKDEDEGLTDFIPLNDARYEELSAEEKVKYTSMAKQKIAREKNELLNPELLKDAMEIRGDLETWLVDDSVMKAAYEIEKEKNKDKDPEEDKEEEEDDDGNLSDVDDDEIEAMILTPEEINLKTKIWYNANKQYLEEMAIRRMVEKDKGGSRRGKGSKKKKIPLATTPAEAAKQLLEKKKMSKKINQAVFDDMFESAESIAKIKQRDAISRISGTSSAIISVPEYEVVEEPGNVDDNKKDKADKEKKEEKEEVEEEDDEEMDSDDMADDERFLRDQRARFDADDDVAEGYSDEDW